MFVSPPFLSARWLKTCSLLLGLAGAAMRAGTVPVFDVRAHGAKGDGATVDTGGINAAIDAAAAAGGGTIYFPPGTYLSGSIRLKSNVTLYLEAGATLEAASEKATKFDPPEPNELADKFHYQDFAHSHWQNSLIWGIGLRNVAILGPGLIHGRGLDSGFNRFADETKGEQRYRANPAGSGNKAIALRDCRNVILRDFSILHGGWFAILATGVDNLTIDNLKLDTNRDGMDIDACENVRITNTSVNSPWDDGICLKASYALGRIKHCDNITISNCFLAGSFDEGTLLDATFKRSEPAYKSYGTGRIKLGTESNGDFKNITITNCVFDGSRGIAIESVDGSHIEDVAIANIAMRHVQNSPIFIRLGARLRGPAGTQVGTIRRISVNNLVVSDAAWSLGNVISGIPGHPVEDLRFSNIQLVVQGGGQAELAARVPPENEKTYPEPGMFGDMPSYGFFFRHVTGVEMHDVKLGCATPEARPAVVLDDVRDAWFHHVNFARSIGTAPQFDLRDVTGLSITDSRDTPDLRQPGTVQGLEYPVYFSPAALRGRGLGEHDFLYAGEWDTRKEQQSMFLVRGGKVVWSYSIPLRPTPKQVQEFDDAELLPNGNILFSRMLGAGIVNPQKQLVWEYLAPAGTEIHSAQSLGGDRVLIMRNGNPAQAMIFNTATKAIEREIPIPTTVTGTHGQFRHIRMTPAGTLLVPHLSEGKVVEYSLDGKALWSVAAKSPWSAVRLKNGNTLIAGDHSGYVREVSAAGVTVWEFTQADVPDIKIFNLQTANRLANGNTVICNWCAGHKQMSDWPDTVQVLEVTPEKRVTWALRAWTGDADLGPSTSIQLLGTHELR